MMLILKNTILLAAIGFSITVKSAPVDHATIKDLKCAADPQDPYDPAARISKASKHFALQCLDNSLYRPVRYLGHQVVGQQISDLRVANLKVDGKYWIGVFPGTTWVEKVIFQVENFSTGSATLDHFITPAHTMLRLVLKDSARVDLYDQLNPTGPVVRHAALKNLNISTDSALTKSGAYNFLQEVEPNYPISVGFIATRDRVLQQYFEEGATEFHKVEQFPLVMTQEEMDAVLYSAITYGERLQLNYFYNTLDFNCVTEAFRVLDRAILSRHLNVKPFHVDYSVDPVRAPALRSLRERGLLDLEHTMVPLSEETGDGKYILP